MVPPNPSRNPAADLKAQELKALLTKLTTGPANVDTTPTDIANLKVQIEEANRTEILKATQTELVALQAVIDITKEHSTIKAVLNADETANLAAMNDAVSIEMNKTRTAALGVLDGVHLNDIADDIQPLGKDNISEEEEGGPADMVQKLMFTFQKLKLAFDKMITFDPAKKEALANQEKQLMIQEFTLLGARGLREKFQEKGVEYGIQVRNGIRDKTAFTKFLEVYKKEPGDIDAFVDQQLAIASPKIGASKTNPKPTETTLYGLMASKGRESTRRLLLGTEQTLQYSDKEQYTLKFENNRITITDLNSNNTHSYELKTVGGSSTDALTAAATGGAPGIPAGALELLGGAEGKTAFTSAELEDKGDNITDKRLGFSFRGKSGLMGLGTQRASVSIENEALRNVLKKLANGDPTELKKLVDRKVVAKGIFAKLKGDIEFKIEKVR